MAVIVEQIATDLGVAPPPPGSVTASQWEMWIADAEMLIEDRRLELLADPIRVEKVDYVVRKAVVAHVKKPDDATTITIAVDDGTSTRRYESGTGQVSVSDWWEYLGLTDGTDGAYTIYPFSNHVASDPLAW